jgi:type IV fimbrial biogenesis protein FimT
MRDETPASGIVVSGPAAGIVFRSSGRIDAQAAVVACKAVTNPAQNQRAVTVLISGVSNITKSNGGGACP